MNELDIFSSINLFSGSMMKDLQENALTQARKSITLRYFTSLLILAVNPEESVKLKPPKYRTLRSFLQAGELIPLKLLY